MRSLFRVELEYLPTGEKVAIDGDRYMSVRKGKELGMRVLRSKLVAPRVEPSYYEYDLLDDEPSPDELMKYRRKI